MNQEQVHEFIDRWFTTGKVKDYDQYKIRLSPDEKEIRIRVTR